MDKVIELVKRNNNITVHIENVTIVDLVTFLSHVVIDVAKDAKEDGGMGAYGQFLDIIEKTFNAKTIDFMVNNLERDDFIERTMEELLGDKASEVAER